MYLPITNHKLLGTFRRSSPKPIRSLAHPSPYIIYNLVLITNYNLVLITSYAVGNNCELRTSGRFSTKPIRPLAHPSPPHPVAFANRSTYKLVLLTNYKLVLITNDKSVLITNPTVGTNCELRTSRRSSPKPIRSLGHTLKGILY